VRGPGFHRPCTDVNCGGCAILDSTSKQLGLIPIIENVDVTTNWTRGSMQVRVTGFTWFVIISVELTR
jgi:hypothetical protein